MVAVFLNFGAAAHNNSASAGRIGGADAGAAHDDAAGREVRPFDVLHDVGKLGVGVVDEQADGVHHLAQVVRRDVGRHADGNTHGAVHDEVRETGREHDRLLQTVVIVAGEIDGLAVDVREHVERHLAHARLGIAVGSGGMAVDGAEVAVTVNERIAERKILCHTHHRVIHRRIAVRMVSAEHRADRVRALAVGLVRRQAVFVHGVQDAAVHRLQTVPHIRQRTRHDDRHGIFKEALFHFLFEIHGKDLRHLTAARGLLGGKRRIVSKFVHSQPFLSLFRQRSTSARNASISSMQRRGR